MRDHTQGGETGADAPGGTTVDPTPEGPIVRDHRPADEEPATGVQTAPVPREGIRAELVDAAFEEQMSAATDAGPPAGGEPKPAPESEPEPAPASEAAPDPAPAPAADALGADQVHAEVAAAEAAAPPPPPAPATDVPAAEAPAPAEVPEPEPVMAGVGADDPLAADPLGISREDIEPASDFGDDRDDGQPDAADDGPADHTDGS